LEGLIINKAEPQAQDSDKYSEYTTELTPEDLQQLPSHERVCFEQKCLSRLFDFCSQGNTQRVKQDETKALKELIAIHHPLTIEMCFLWLKRREKQDTPRIAKPMCYLNSGFIKQILPEVQANFIKERQKNNKAKQAALAREAAELKTELAAVNLKNTLDLFNAAYKSEAEKRAALEEIIKKHSDKFFGLSRDPSREPVRSIAIELWRDNQNSNDTRLELIPAQKQEASGA
jgi:hypothetical protein